MMLQAQYSWVRVVAKRARVGDSPQRTKTHHFGAKWGCCFILS
jgi:hypothetical protein